MGTLYGTRTDPQTLHPITRDYPITKGLELTRSLFRWPWKFRHKYEELKEQHAASVRTVMGLLGANQQLKIEREKMIREGVEYQRKLEESIDRLQDAVVQLEERLRNYVG